nr:hypothetical protein BaRGS_031362 [Batillaria attramentaria]
MVASAGNPAIFGSAALRFKYTSQSRFSFPEAHVGSGASELVRGRPVLEAQLPGFQSLLWAADRLSERVVVFSGFSLQAVERRHAGIHDSELAALLVEFAVVLLSMGVVENDELEEVLLLLLSDGDACSAGEAAFCSVTESELRLVGALMPGSEALLALASI